jgi:copper(I)-binding protein
MRFTLPAALAAACLLINPAWADSIKIGTLEITNLWARATPPRAVAGGGFMTITNTGDEPDRLIALASPIAAIGEVHEMKVEDGVMTMRPLKDGLEIPAHGSVTLAPGGYHVMFIDLKEPIVAGTDVPVTLTFAKAGVVETRLHAAPIGAPGPEGGDDGMDGGTQDGMMQEGQMQ